MSPISRIASHMSWPSTGDGLHAGCIILIFIGVLLRDMEMGDIEEHLQRGISFKVEGRYEEAIAEIKAVLAVDSCHDEACRQLGLIYGFIGLFDESLEELKKAVELNPQNVAARNDLAMTYAMLGMIEEAKAELLTVLELDPANEAARKQLVYF